ncbi:RNA 2',3'-cyclic phosphodiesterase [Azoarcus sp. TTM-91]|uniref:RNA 2',3'-cyclic phosphodiesterase n=1 Tax=Azoarcus sp. TTM-91 TaxID=2691581 RepID=UPI00145F0653|nr:RNA 2',3'-cyclic phosphodiesterase [Azoarcus sp. TTM-91]NMG34295.1 RNA 2',3'-cyclic phosphodiesterase [Azoarcus sp. TTM-91]
MSERARVFFACWPSPGLARAIHRQALRLQQSCKGRVMRPDTLHMTLAFLGDVERHRLPELQAVASRVAAVPFRISLTRQGSWHGHRIIWLAPEEVPAPLDLLQTKLCAGLRSAGFQLEGGSYKPHVTVLRNARSAPAEACCGEGLGWAVDAFRLVESQRLPDGASYRTLGEWPL